MKIRDILIGVLLVLCIFLFFDGSCSRGKLDISRNGHEDQKIATLEVQLKADKKISDLLTVLSKKDEEIEHLETGIRKRDLKDVEKERKIEELEKEEIVLVDKGEIIVNLHAQISGWKERFALASNTIDDKDKIIFSLRAQYDIQVKITLEWETKFNAERALRASAENVIKEAVKEIKVLKFKSSLKTGGVALIGGILLYTVLK